jgi:phosphomethylpyrimidine synthase
MKTTKDVRKYAAERGIAEDEALKRGLEAKSKKFVERARRFAQICESVIGLP